MRAALPNALTVGRLLAAPLVGLLVLAGTGGDAARAAFLVFAAAAATDFLDGWLARRLGATSALGRALDPIADKAMVVIALSALMARAGPDAALGLPAIAILFREILVAGLREATGSLALAVTPLAKWKTAAQLVAVAALLAAPAFGLPALPGLVLLWLAAILTIVTGADYVSKAVGHLRGRG